MISTYNGQEQAVKNLAAVVAKQIKIFGFLVLALHYKYIDEFYEVFPGMIASGKIRYTEDITKGLEYAGHAILDVQSGRNKAKSVVLVAEE